MTEFCVRGVFVLSYIRYPVIEVRGGGGGAERTLRGLHDQRLAVLAHSAGIKGFHSGLVCAVEVEPVHGADGLRPHVHFL